MQDVEVGVEVVVGADEVEGAVEVEKVEVAGVDLRDPDRVIQNKNGLLQEPTLLEVVGGWTETVQVTKQVHLWGTEEVFMMVEITTLLDLVMAGKIMGIMAKVCSVIITDPTVDYLVEAKSPLLWVLEQDT